MPDPTNQNLSNPQDLVDAALGTAPTVPPTPPSPPPTPVPTTPPIQTIPEPVVAPISSSVPMGDETPLAFATMPTPPSPTSSPTSSPTPTNSTPNVDPVQQSSYLPPSPSVPHAPVKMNVGKPKRKMGIVLGGILMLVLALGGGLWGYQSYQGTKQTASINITSDEFEQKQILTGYGTNEEKLKIINDEFNDGPDYKNMDEAKKGLSAEVRQTLENVYGKIPKAGNCLPGDGCPIQCTALQMVNKSIWQEVTEPGGGKYCDDQGRQCSRYRIERSDGKTWCFVDYGEQCGEEGSCGPNVEKTPPPVVPTMACTGLNVSPTTTPVIGTALTFTCAGSVTPTTAGTLSYKYRYSINGGAYTAMTNNKLTIAACGTYFVECQACATLNGVLKCDPTWTGATQ